MTNPKESCEPLFRVGGVYRDKAGYVITLRAAPSDDYIKWGANEAWAFKDGGYGYGTRDLFNGVCTECPEEEEYHLIPGELHCVNGEWLPIGEVLREKLVTKPEPAEVLTSKQMWDLVRGAEPAEPTRPPLDWAKPKAFDPFADFTVTTSAEKATTVAQTATADPHGYPFCAFRSPDFVPV